MVVYNPATEYTNLETQEEREKYLTRLSNRDEEAWKQLAHTIGEYARKITGEHNISEEIASDVMLKMLSQKRLDSYDPRQKFEPWLAAIIKHAWIDRLRKDGRRPAVFSLDNLVNSQPNTSQTFAGIITDEKTCGPENDSIKKDVADSLNAARSRLPSIYRTIISRMYYNNWKIRQIARNLRVPEGTVKSRLSKALSIIRKDPELITAYE